MHLEFYQKRNSLSKCPQIVGRWGIASDPTARAYSALTDSLAGLRGLLLRGGERRSKRKEGEGMTLAPHNVGNRLSTAKKIDESFNMTRSTLSKSLFSVLVVTRHKSNAYCNALLFGVTSQRVTFLRLGNG